MANEAELPVQEEFDELDIRPGMMVEVLTMKNVLTFVGRVRSFSPNAVLTIKEAADAELPPVLYNQEVKLRFFQRDRSLVLRGQICGSTRWIWRVDRLESQFGAEQRMFFRQNVNLTAQVQKVQEAEGEETLTSPTPCTVLDISVGGLMVTTRAALETGDRLVVSGACVVDEVGPFSFRCRVQRVQKSGMNFICGCKFEDLSNREEDRLLQAIFIAQRKEIHKQRDRSY